MGIVPFGLTNAPLCYQRFVIDCLSGLRDTICVPYLDDTGIYSKSIVEHVGYIHTVLRRLSSCGVKREVSKCAMFQRCMLSWSRCFLWRLPTIISSVTRKENETRRSHSSFFAITQQNFFIKLYTQIYTIRSLGWSLFTSLYQPDLSNIKAVTSLAVNPPMNIGELRKGKFPEGESDIFDTVNSQV